MSFQPTPCFSTSAWRPRASTTSRRRSVNAVTVAERRSWSITPISPVNPPGPTTATCTPNTHRRLSFEDEEGFATRRRAFLDEDVAFGHLGLVDQLRDLVQLAIVATREQ